ncbi:MAG: proteasome subunit beta, partial [Acidimicrobiia bacterium]
MNHEPGLPAFSDTGSSFVELLRKVAPEALPPAVLGQGTQPFEITHGTTVVAIRCEGGVVMAGDRRAT